MVTGHPRARILVVDDLQAVGRLMGEMLEIRGYEATVMTDTGSALQYFLNHGEDVDLVITDHSMPGMTGLELAKRMLECKPGLPIVLISGSIAGVDERTAAAAGISLYLQKPISIDDLVGKLQQLHQGME